MDMMRIPLATILFIGSVGLLFTMQTGTSTFFKGLDSMTSGIIAVVAIVCLVYSIVLYTNMNAVK